MEDCRSVGSMPFLDTLVTARSDGSLSTTVYRKPTYTVHMDTSHSVWSHVIWIFSRKEKLFSQ